MKSTILRLVLAAFLLPTLSLPAQVSAPDAKKSAIESRLAQAIKLFPEADADKDGTLSVNEALSYLDAHPEMKELLQKMNVGGGSRSQAATFAPGDAGTRVFVCGHSYMIFTAGMLPAVSKFAGIPYLSAGQQMIGGSQVIQHWNLPDEKNQAKKALREGIVDVLMLSPTLLLPDPGIDNFTKLGLEKNPKLRVLVQASWVPWDGKASAAFKNELRDAVTVEELHQMQDIHHSGWLKKLEDQVTQLNAAVGKQVVCIVPVSAAVYALRERVAEGKAPGLTKQSELFKDDHGHPGPPMALLVTYCHFAAIHQRSPVGLQLPASIKDRPQAGELNRLLQQIAWETVSSYPLSGVKAPTALRDK
jgi:hypothetical protein